jgi:ABC-type Na+ transport system ATPase subunit NatA
VELRGLTVRYGRRSILDGVSLSVARGSVYALPRTQRRRQELALRCLLGQQKPSAGEGALFGQDAWRGRRSLMERVGYVPEEPDAPPELCARELVLFCGRLNVRWNEAAVIGRLERFLVPAADAVPQPVEGAEGSGDAALALGHDPELLLLDDPTLGLDVVARRAVFGELIGELATATPACSSRRTTSPASKGVADRVGHPARQPPRARGRARGAQGRARRVARGDLRGRRGRARRRRAAGATAREPGSEGAPAITVRELRERWDAAVRALRVGLLSALPRPLRGHHGTAAGDDDRGGVRVGRWRC